MTSALSKIGLLFPLVILAVALASAAVMSCAPRTSWAQAQLTLAHLNPDNDLEFDFAAVVVSGGSANSGASNLYAAGGWGTAGSIAEGDLDFGSGSGSFARIRTTNDNSRLRLNGPQSGAAVDLPTVFNAGGERSGWSFYVMTSPDDGRIELDSFSAGSANAMDVDLTSEMTSGQLTAWRAMRSGHRFILALGRANTNPPTISSVTASGDSGESVTLNATITNASSALVTLHYRYRASGAPQWTSAGTSTTQGTSATKTLTGLSPGQTYEAEVSVTSAFAPDSTTQTKFSTAAMPTAVPTPVPIFSESVYTRSIHENALEGTPVGVPVRGLAPGRTLTYTLGGTDAASFTVDANTGQLRVGSGTVLDFETKASYSLTITAAGPNGQTDTADVVINVVDLDEMEGLGAVEFVIGNSGSDYGYVQGSYGSLSSGNFPKELFDGGPDRTVSEFREDAEGFWHLRYGGGTADDWLSDEAGLDAILARVAYEDGADGREFVLGGFVAGRQGSNRLKLEPPIPSRDFESRSGETVRVEFVRHVAEAHPTVMTQLIPPDAKDNSSVAFLSEITPGGPEVFQNLIVLLVFGTWMLKGNHSGYSLLLAGVILVLTPWVPVIFQVGTPLPAAINFVNILLGAYVYKYYFESREQYS